MARPRSPEERAVAERLRTIDGKSFPEIAAILGINQSTVCRWAQAGGWPSPHEPRQELKQIVKQAKAGNGSDGSNGNGGNGADAPRARSSSRPDKDPDREIIPDDMPEVDFTADSEQLADQLFRWAMKALQNVSRFSVPTLIKVAEIAARVHIAQHTPKPGEERRLTVLIPGQTEKYRGALNE